MMNPSLLSRLEAARASLMVVGLGYVGTPVACRFAQAGFKTTGLDIDARKIALITAGQLPMEGHEPGLAEMLAEVVESGHLKATLDASAASQADIVLFAVDTPVDGSDHKPRYAALGAALRSVAAHLNPGTMVIIESTLAPGTMRDIVQPAIESASDLKVGENVHLVHCPERVMPGRLLANLAQMDRVIGASSPQAAELALAFYRHVVEGDLDTTDLLTAELVKTCENAYRDVQIAFSNELALICQDLGGDVWRLRELVNKSPGRNMLLPGAGVGGHCIPKDPWLLIANVSPEVETRLIPTARQVNRSMPAAVRDLLADAIASGSTESSNTPLEGQTIALLGYSYLEESDDTRNSPTAELIQILEPQVGELRIHDPWVPEYKGDLDTCLKGADAAIIMVAHQLYRDMDLSRLPGLLSQPVLIDARGIVDEAEAETAGLLFRKIGVGRTG